jgi:hypothetical protein
MALVQHFSERHQNSRRRAYSRGSESGRELDRIREDHPDQTVAIVSHAEVLRAALGYYMGVPLDLLLRIELSPASVSILHINEHGPRIAGLNDTSHLSALSPGTRHATPTTNREQPRHGPAFDAQDSFDSSFDSEEAHPWLKR